MYPNESCGWTPVLLSADLPVRAAAPGVVNCVDVAIWRGKSGAVSVCLDRCPHRGMRLSHGFVRDDRLNCIYHGWNFGTDGVCKHIPAHPDLVPPPSINTTPQTVMERGGIVWAGGTVEGASPPDFSGKEPLRSMMFAADFGTVAKHCDPATQDDGLLVCSAGTVTFYLLTAQRGDETLVHILVDGTATVADKLKVSGSAELLRRRIETHCKEEAA